MRLNYGTSLNYSSWSVSTQTCSISFVKAVLAPSFRLTTGRDKLRKSNREIIKECSVWHKQRWNMCVHSCELQIRVCFSRHKEKCEGQNVFGKDQGNTLSVFHVYLFWTSRSAGEVPSQIVQFILIEHLYLFPQRVKSFPVLKSAPVGSVRFSACCTVNP